MVDYTVETYNTGVKKTIEDVLDTLETKIETIANTKTIRMYGITSYGSNAFVGWLIYDT